MRLAIIPARGGSKRLPDKNKLLLGSLPLISWTANIAESHFDKIIVTSDSESILNIAKENGLRTDKYVYSLRPKELSTDTSKVIDTVSYYFDMEDGKFDEIWLLLPTCPFRTDNDFDKMKKIISDPEVDGCLSITDPEFPPTLFLKEVGGYLTGSGDGHPFAEGNSRSQDQPKAYRPNGAMYAMKWDSFNKNRNFYKGRVKGYYMPRERSIDIDNKIDFKIAEALLSEE